MLNRQLCRVQQLHGRHWFVWHAAICVLHSPPLYEVLHAVCFIALGWLLSMAGCSIGGAWVRKMCQHIIIYPCWSSRLTELVHITKAGKVCGEASRPRGHPSGSPTSANAVPFKKTKGSVSAHSYARCSIQSSWTLSPVSRETIALSSVQKWIFTHKMSNVSSASLLD